MLEGGRVGTTQRRAYDTSGRRAAAERNRLAVIDASRELLLRDGYQATTIGAIAERAGVSTELIYKTFGSKQRLMKAVYDVALAGDAEPVPIGQRPAIARIMAEPDARAKIELYAAFVEDLMARLGGLLAVLAEADPELAELRVTTEGERLIGASAFVGHLHEQGHLAPGTDLARAADACWVQTSPQLFAQLAITRGWSPGDYRSWLATVLTASLLPPA
ncbi:AcrR family transcriptional regulator [Allocatelliglobosispora scoriae]|uniref:AcrR family transcriptional regulator n=1 Tax=Allocatelliglobosispora scoriae TaxID=643052 RepID=A0A841BMW7_9ACTN|nr:TetR/AcrR family transcriptional regulator [Allocatelliglobosispora scoriae]MBB5868313.1 AcrR family transcriptional regulator [Allocatelliglobosispora scoriae]